MLSSTTLQNLARRGAVLRSQLRRTARFSTSTDPVSRPPRAGRGGGGGGGGGDGGAREAPPPPSLNPESPAWFDRMDVFLSSPQAQSTMSETMAAHPYATFLTGAAIGYFSAMYMERTKFKDEFVRDARHKTTTSAVTGLPTK